MNLKIYSKNKFYNGSGYRIDVAYTDVMVPSHTPYLKVPCESPMFGAIFKGNVVMSYYCYSHKLKGFHTFNKKDIFERYLQMFHKDLIGGE